MEKYNFNDIQQKGLLLYHYIRGSKVYGTEVPDSDTDHGFIYILPPQRLLDLGLNYQSEITSEKHDDAGWEIGRFLQLALKSNPTVLEALFIPDDKVIYEHPLITELKKHRDQFLTKRCFKPLGGYMVSQIEKARGQNKKIHWDINQMTRKTPLDFAYTFHKQGSQNIQPWLEERGLDQRNIGLVNIPNMEGVYGAYYDFGQHIKLNGISKEYFCCPVAYRNDKFIKYCIDNLSKKLVWWKRIFRKKQNLYNSIVTPKGGHCGIISPNMDSTEVRYNSHVNFSPVKKGDEPICWIVYNQSAYENHCRKYKEYEEWKQKRNKARYENNLKGLDKNNSELFYDAKNMMHSFRLATMAIEIAKGEGMKVNRTGIDADFLLDVRNRKYTYAELIDKLEVLKANMNEAFNASTLPEEIDVEFVNDMLLSIRHSFTYESEHKAMD